MILQEKWRPVQGYEGRYEVSNLGEVRDSRYKYKLSQYKLEGYSAVCLYDGQGGRSMKLVHRLVAFAFLPNPNNYPIINHKNENKRDNAVSNLEWCTYSYNNTYGSARDKYKNNPYNESKKRPVLCVETGVVYESVREARRQSGANNINKVLAGKKKRSGGCHWQYYNTDQPRCQEEIIVTLS